jgi:hypothetical protein
MPFSFPQTCIFLMAPSTEKKSEEKQQGKSILLFVHCELKMDNANEFEQHAQQG